MKRLWALSVAALLGASQDKAPELTAARVDKLPAIDGKADDEAWKKAPELVVRIDIPDKLDDPKKKISLKAVHDGDSVCILAVWEDKTANTQHLPYVWSADHYELPAENEVEDALSLAFPLAGPFNTDMFAGVESKWDVWEWRAYRANNGFAQDRWHVYTRQKPDGIKTRPYTDKDDKRIFIGRADDAGTPAAKKVEEPPQDKKGDKFPQWELQAPAGSCSDVAAKGVWAGGQWTVELKRKLKTGHDDDTVFDPAKGVEFAVAVFDACEKRDHDVSGKLMLKFGK